MSKRKVKSKPKVVNSNYCTESILRYNSKMTEIRTRCIERRSDKLFNKLSETAGFAFVQVIRAGTMS